MDSLPLLLTAQHVQMLFHVDRSTIYRMAEDGRIPAIKVGRQWRFPREQVLALLEGAAGTTRPDATPTAATLGLASVLTLPGAPAPALSAAVAEPVVQVASDLLGVMMVVTDMDGRPVTGVTNPCPWFASRLGDPHLLDACTAEWRELADEVDFEPRFRTGALGFDCARAFIRHGSTLVGMVMAGGVAPVDDLPTAVAEGASPREIAGLYRLDDAGRARVLAALPRVAAALSRPRTET